MPSLRLSDHCADAKISAAAATSNSRFFSTFFALLENYESVHTHQHMHPLTERNTEYLWDLQCLFKVIECRARKEKRGEEKSPLPKKIMASCVPEFNPQQFEVMEFRSQPACVVVGGC